MFENFPSQLNFIEDNDNVMVEFNGLKTDFLKKSDLFFKRITEDNLNSDRLEDHLCYEIKIKNTLDEAVNLLNHQHYSGAILKFDEVLYYDYSYADALFYKSKALFFQKHYVKSLRFYKKAVSFEPSLGDGEYFRLLLKSAGIERDNFPKLKQNIYNGDEYVGKGDYKNALISYDKALSNPSKFKSKILYKLLNKKAFVLFKLMCYSESYETYTQSIKTHPNDISYFGCAYSLYMLSQKSESSCETCLDKMYEKNIYDNLLKAENIDKKSMIIKAEILKNLNYKNESLKVIEEFLNTHFKQDDDYLKANEIRMMLV